MDDWLSIWGYLAADLCCPRMVVYLNRDCHFVKERVTFYGVRFNRSGDDDGIPFLDDGGFLINAILNTGGTFGTQQYFHTL